MPCNANELIYFMMTNKVRGSKARDPSSKTWKKPYVYKWKMTYRNVCQ
jgi:hypothetical protein